MRESPSEEFLKRVCPPRRRYIMAVVLGLGFLSFYSTILAFYQARRYMMRPPYNSANTKPICNATLEQRTAAKGIGNKYYTLKKWDLRIVSLINMAMYVPYCLNHFVAGILVVRFSPKKVLTCATLVIAATSVTTPLFLLNTDTDYIALMIGRFVSGAALGIAYPVVHEILGSWTPARDRGKLSAIVFMCGDLAPPLTYQFANKLILQTEDPKKVFYIYGGILFGWVLLWIFFGHSNYEQCKRLSENERKYLKREFGHQVYFGPKKIPWGSVLTSPPVWVLALTSMSRGVVWQVSIYVVPYFVERILGYRNEDVKLTIRSTGSYIAGSLLIPLGIFSDWTINRGYIQRTTCRKIYTTIGSMGPGFFLVAMIYSYCNLDSFITMHVIGICLAGFYYIGTKVNTLDLAPNFNGLMGGIAHGCEAFASFCTNYVVLKMMEEHHPGKWRNVFWILLMVLSITTLLYVLFGSGEVQPWNDVDRDDKKISYVDDEDEEVFDESPRPGTSSTGQ